MLKTRIATTIILGAIILSACGGVTPYPTPSTPSPTFIPLTTAPIPIATSLPYVIPTQTYTPTPETLYGYPTAEFVPICGIDCLTLTPNVQRQDITLHELYLGKYVLRSWCIVDQRFDFCSDSAITISSRDSKQIEMSGGQIYFGNETGADLTGDGIPDIVIDRWATGYRPLLTTVYEAGTSLKEITQIWSDSPAALKI